MSLWHICNYTKIYILKRKEKKKKKRWWRPKACLVQLPPLQDALYDPMVDLREKKKKVWRSGVTNLGT
jgi:hypothetical protein